MSTGLRLAMPAAVIVGVATFASAWSLSVQRNVAAPTPRTSDDADISRRAFVKVARVLRHPRCLNCHPSADRPRIGEDRRLHAMNVQRGPDGHGVAGLDCATCHQPRNQNYAGVPGAPHWHLAPRSMGWEDLDDHGLAEQLKDRSRNGDRTLDDLIAHMAEDPLVGWAWTPGVGRSAPPIPRDEFVEAFRTWIEHGAVSPPPGSISY